MMNISRFLLGALLLSATPVLAQPDVPQRTQLPFPMVSPAAAAQMVQPEKPISLHLRDATLQEALDELEKQSGVELNTSWGGEEILQKKLSLDIETRSFRQAFRATLEEAGIKATLRKMGGRGALNVMFGNEDTAASGPVSGEAPFEVRALSLASMSSKTITTGTVPQRQQNSSLSVNLAMEPDVQIPIVGTPQITIIRAVDDKGKSLQMEERFQRPFDFDSGWGSPQVNLSLKAPSSSSLKLAHLEGIATYVIPVKYETWQVDNVLDSKEIAHDFQSAGKTTRVTLSNIRLAGNQLQLDVEVTTAAPVVDGARSPLFSSSQISRAMSFKDANGREFLQGGYNSSGGNNKLTMHATLTLPSQRIRPVVQADRAPVTPEPTPATAPISLTFKTPTEFVQTEVPFSFTNLPLP